MNKPLSLHIKIIFSWIVYMPIVGLSYFAAWLDRKLRFPLSFPRDLDQLSERKPWLIDELKKNNALPSDAVINSCEVTPLKLEIIFRSNAGIIDIHYTHSGEEKLLKCFAKFAPTMGSVWNRAIFNLQLNHIKEIWFNEYFLKVDSVVPAPHVYIARVSALTGNLCLITEHMGDDMEYHDYPYASFPQEHLDMALDGLATLHAQYWGDTSARMAKVQPIEDSTVHLFDSMVAGRWSIPARKVLVKSWCLMNRPQTVLHGDSRIGNMMFPSAPRRGRFVLIDWQATRKGVAAFDLAYFLVLSLMTTHRHELERPAIDRYYGLLLAKGVKGYTPQEFEDDYQHGCLCTLVLLSLPMLSGEVSVDGNAALLFVFGMGIWRERLRQYFLDFDYIWMADSYKMTEQESQYAIAEMIAVIDKRLNGVLASVGSKDTLIDILRRDNVAWEFNV
jgi:hypothetical protein